MGKVTRRNKCIPDPRLAEPAEAAGDAELLTIALREEKGSAVGSRVAGLGSQVASFHTCLRVFPRFIPTGPPLRTLWLLLASPSPFAIISADFC